MKESPFQLTDLCLPWSPLPSARQERIQNELYKEVGPNHLIYNVQVQAIAYRVDQDDYLFYLKNFKSHFAMIHLTFSGKPELNHMFPWTVIYENWPEFIKNCMKDQVR